MAQESQLAHRVLGNLALPYITNTSPASTEPHYVSGSSDILTSIAGYAERRPGFSAALETTPTVFNNLQRLFSWDRFDGTFIEIACDISALGFSQVFKRVVGGDPSFVSIFHDSIATPFDFVVSNNTLYFSNGNVAQKWDPINGISNWGITIGSVNNIIGPNTVATAAQTGAGAVWTNASNITTLLSAYATITLPTVTTLSVASVQITNPGSGFGSPPAIGFTGGGGSGAAAVSTVNYGYLTSITVTNGGSYTSTPTVTIGGPGGAATAYMSGINSTTQSAQSLQGTNLSLALPTLEVVNGITVSFKAIVTVTGAGSAILSCPVQLIVNGNPVGTPKAVGLLTDGVAHTYNAGSSSDLWSAGLNVTTLNNTTFGFQITPALANIVGVYHAAIQVNSFQVTINGVGGPTIAVSGSAGTFSAASGYIYEFCYGNANTGHISSPAPPSANTGIFTNKLNVSVALTASTDPQVNQIRVFRTPDGGGATFFELPTSPYPNTTATILDTSPDINLQVGSIAPIPTFNDPPPPGFSPTYYSGRIHLFNANKLYFSGLEEINQGVPEESFPSGVAGNFWSFDQPLQGQGVAGMGANQTLGILCGGRLYGIQGNSLDTFRRFQVSNRRGCRARTNVSTLGGMMAWIDSANQVWATDGNSLQELSKDIRPTLAGLNHANCSLTFHSAGRFHWLVLSTGAQILVYDVDLDQWMPPWTFAAKYIFSGETSAGNYVLMASNGTKALQMATARNDNGVTYAPIAKVSLLSVIPDFGSRFSYIGMGSYNEPTRTGFPATFQVTNNGQTITDFLILADEDTATGTYTSIAANVTDTATAYNRANGTNLKQWVYPTLTPAARWISMQVKLANADQADNLYELFMAYKPLGGR